MARITHRIVLEASSTTTTPQVLTTINFNTFAGMASTDRFTATISIRAWSYNSSAADAEASSSYGAYDINEIVVVNRDPNQPTLQYVPDNTGAPDSVQTLTHVRGRTDMVTALEANPTGLNSVNISLTAGNAVIDTQTIEHMVIVDIELFSE